MLTLTEYEGIVQDGSAMTEDIIKCLNEGKRGFLILPEQLTVTVEKEMSEVLPPFSPLLFEVSNFTRFSNTVFRSIGGIAKEYCDNSRKALIMWRCLTELSPLLKMTGGRSDIGSGYVSRALDAVAQMQGLGISPQELSEVLSSATDISARLRNKLQDLCLIYSLYKKLINEKYADSLDDLKILSDKLDEDASFLRDTVIFIDGFTSFTEPQYTLLQRLMRFSDVRITLPLPRSRKDAYEFKEIRKTESRLLSIANKAGCEKRLAHVTNYEEKQTAICEVTELIWQQNQIISDSLSKRLKNEECIKIYSADTPFEECDFLAADIRRRVINGAKYNEIAVVARSTDSYVGILDTALVRAKIPHFISKRQDISSFEAIKLILTAYSIVRRGFRKEDVLTYAKCGLAGITRDERDIFELYVEKWGIDGFRFIDGIMWNMNPRGYEPLSDKDNDALVKINKIRDTLLSPIIALSEEIKNAKTVRAEAQALIDFLCEIQLEKRLFARADELEMLGELSAAEENTRLWTVICDCLDILVDTLGDFPADSEAFINQLSVLFSEAGIGRIPAHEDEVTIGSADMLRIKNKKYVYLIGVNRGEFPKNATESSYFSEKEKASLNLMGLPIDPDPEIKNAKELYYFSRAMSSAKKEVTLLWSERTAAFAEAGPSMAISAITDITGGAVCTKKINQLPIKDTIYTPEGALQLSSDATRFYKEISLALEKAGYTDNLTVSEGDIENRELMLGSDTLGVLYKGDLFLSQTKIDNFLRCPMNYFCKYNLRLDSQENAEINNPVIGTFIHSILENFFSEAARLGKSASEMTKEERKRLTESSAKQYVKEVLGNGFGSARAEVTIRRLCRAAEPVIDSLCDEFANCKFTPLLFEVSINDKNESNPEPIKILTRDGSKIIIGGQIDRVDAYKSGDRIYVRVVDYKTGGKDFTPSDIKEGRNLQMFLYLKSVVETNRSAFKERLGASEGQKLIPAGVIYVKATVKDAKLRQYDDSAALNAVKQQQQRDGMLLSNEQSISAMNPEFLPLNPDNPRHAAKLFTEEGWDLLNRDIEKAVIDISEKIKCGNINAMPNPKDRPCESCKFKPICRSMK